MFGSEMFGVVKGNVTRSNLGSFYVKREFPVVFFKKTDRMDERYGFVGLYPRSGEQHKAVRYLEKKRKVVKQFYNVTRLLSLISTCSQGKVRIWRSKVHRKSSTELGVVTWQGDHRKDGNFTEP